MKTLVILVILAISLASCTSDSATDTEKIGNKEKNLNTSDLQSAQIINEGDPSVDGCGWIIYVGEDRYKPVNLSDNFKTDSLDIQLAYTKTGTTYPCGLMAQPIDEIEIVQIEEEQ